MGWSAVAPIILILINAPWIQASSVTSQVSSARNLKALQLSISTESWVGEITEKAGKLYGRCSLQNAESPDNGAGQEPQCDDSLSCVPVLTVPVEASARNLLERSGMCVEFSSGKAINGRTHLPSAYIFDSLNDRPLPIGYFPLTFEDTTSWPFPSFVGSLDAADFVKDDVFGSALLCKQSVVELPNVPYTADGDFTVNFWVKVDDKDEDVGLGYIFSHKKKGSEEERIEYPQIQVYLPRDSLPVHGIVRSVVKDMNDLEQGPAVNSFVDSDGEVGNNLDRDVSSRFVNVNDGRWHMITVTSQGAGEKGFILYMDGEVAGELAMSTKLDADSSNDIQITGGDPLNMDGPINLCGNPDIEDGLFNGRLAHLALFDQALSPESVKDMFEILVSTKIQADQVKDLPSVGESRGGKKCLFPAIYRGELVNSCVPREATKECPTSAGVWEECSFFSSEKVDFFQTLDGLEAPYDEPLFVTVDGDACQLPMYYAGVYHNECIDLHGTPSCFTDGGVWKECAGSEPRKDLATKSLSKVARTTIHGEECVFPFEYNGEIFEDCTNIFGDWSCGIATGEYFPCAVERDPATIYRENSTAPVISRITMGGDACFFPLWYGDESIADCFPADGGILSCPTTPGDIEPCAPLRLTINGIPCAIPFFFDGEEHYDCAEHAGNTICMTADGSIDQCAPYSSLPQPYRGTEGLHAITARGTVTDENCAFPYWYGGKLVSECITEEGVEYCQTGDGAWRECLPQVFTEDGRECSIPFHHEDDFHFDCIVLDGSYQCPTALDEPWGDCKGYYYAPVPEPSSEFDDLEEDESLLLMDALAEGETLEVPHGSTEDHFVGPNQADYLSQSWIGELTGSPGEELGDCRLPSTYVPSPEGKEMSECSSDNLSCIPIRIPSKLNLTAGTRVGGCFGFPGEADESPVYVFDVDNDMPVPQAYFPLSHNNVDSWPFDHLKGEIGDQKFVDDEIFGSVLQCGKGTVKLPSTPYAADGQFTISMWMKTDAPAPGIGFEYIFSHMREDATAGLRGLSQIQLYLLRQLIPSHGVLRAIVKDNNDEDEGRASDSFVDSDGMIGNNLAREFGSDHVDFYDGHWHMVTVSSKEDSTAGFRLFVDGALVGEMGAEKVTVKNKGREVELQVTGGDPIDLSGKIHLCGRAVESNQRYFNGQIAHLAIFSTPLSAEHIRDLFETYMATRAQSEGRPITTTELTTINGDTCLFPALHKGKWVDACVAIGEVEKCPSGPGRWVECGSTSTKPDAKFVTIDDEPCELPIFYDGALHNECVQIEGKPMCHASKGPWKGCRPSMNSVVQRWDPPSWEEQNGTHEFDLAGYQASIAKSSEEQETDENVLSDDFLNHEGLFETVDAEECELPIFYEGKLHYRCVPMDGVPMCHAPGGMWKECRLKVDKEAEEESGKEALSSENTSESATRVTHDPDSGFAMDPEAPAITRVTVDGDQCYFPYWYGEESISGCFFSEGRQNCPTKDGTIKECAPVRLTVDGLPCAMPFTYKRKEYSDCVEIDGAEHCRTADGDLKQCDLANNQQTQTNEYTVVTARATVEGTNCALPFWYKGKLVSDCVQEGSDEYCQSMFGGWEKCAPQKFTVDQKRCSIPFHHEGKNYFDCINLGGVRKCPTAALEPWGECAPELTGTGRSSTG